jgi:hypothetical protein
MVSRVRWIRVSASTPPSPSTDLAHRTSFKEEMATSSLGTSLERDDGTRLPLRRVAVSKLPAWRQDLFGFRSFTCKSQEITSRSAVLSSHLQARKPSLPLRAHPIHLHHDLPRTYHDHDCILEHPSDYPRLSGSAIRLYSGPTGLDLDPSERVQGPLNL